MNKNINLNYQDVIIFLNKVINLMEEDKYISQKEYNEYTKRYLNYYKNIDKKNKYFEPFNIIYNPNFLKKHNNKYLNKKLIENKEYFDNMFKNIDSSILLDDNQRKAIIADEDYLLIVAGAGSGKTTTMAAKVKYLIEKQNVNPREIAVISFTNKACEEISKRINKDFGFNDVDVYTFHQLGLKILRGSGREIVNIADDGSKYKIFSNYIKNVVFNDKNFFKKFITAFSDKLYFDSEYNGYNSFKDYHNSNYNKKLISSKFNLNNYNQHEIKKRMARLKTINGEYVKSKEEVLIANFLYEKS